MALSQTRLISLSWELQEYCTFIALFLLCSMGVYLRLRKHKRTGKKTFAQKQKQNRNKTESNKKHAHLSKNKNKTESNRKTRALARLDRVKLLEWVERPAVGSSSLVRVGRVKSSYLLTFCSLRPFLNSHLFYSQCTP